MRHSDTTKTNHIQLMKMLLTVSIVSTLVLLPPNIQAAIGKWSNGDRWSPNNSNVTPANCAWEIFKVGVFVCIHMFVCISLFIRWNGHGMALRI